MDAVILAVVCASWAAEPVAQRSETRLSGIALVRTQDLTWTSEAFVLGVSHQFRTPFVLGLDVVTGLEHPPSYEVLGELDVTAHRDPSLWFDLWPRFGYTVRAGRVDATPSLLWSVDEMADSFDPGVPYLVADVGWWWNDHWSLQGHVGPRKLWADDSLRNGFFDVGVGVAWRTRSPHAEK